MPSMNGHGLKRAVLWAILYPRVSTDEQARSGYSLAQQLEALREYAAREGYEVLEEVVDPGESGATLERPGLDRVRDLVAAGGVCVVLAQDRDRFSREPAYLYLLREEFAAHGTRIKSLNDRGDDSPLKDNLPTASSTSLPSSSGRKQPSAAAGARNRKPASERYSPPGPPMVSIGTPPETAT
jgi:predicted site-specific integrase-resolvase